MFDAEISEPTDSPKNQPNESPYRLASSEPNQRLIFTRGASRLTLESMNDSLEIIETDFDGAPTRVTRAHDEIRIAFDYSLWSFWYDALMAGPTEMPHPTVRLNLSRVWDIQFRGGLSKVEARLDKLAVSQVTIQGGVAKALLVLGNPSGVVPIRVRGGVSRLELIRPAGVGVRLSVRGGVGHLALDSTELAAVGGGLAMHSREGADSPDRYEVHIGGGASHLVIA